MKVLFLSAANSIHTVRWVNGLADRGYEVHLVYNQGHNPIENRIDKNVVLHCLKYSGTKAYYLNAKELRKLSKKIRPDIINVHYASGYGTLARMAGLKNILLSVWGSDVYDFPYESKVKNIILKKNVNYATRLASTSQCMANQLRKVMGNDNLEITITPFGVDTQLFSPDRFEEVESDHIVIGIIKALEKKYGIEDFIRSVDVLITHLSDRDKSDVADKIRAEIYGSGSQEEYLRNLIKELHLEDKIELKGRVENKLVPNVLKNFDVFCAASTLDSESFGVAVVEAMSMEVPVVVTDVDGFKEVVADGETGFVVPKGNIEAMAEKLEKFILDWELRKDFGKAGRKRVEKYYDWQKNVDTMEKLYEELEG